LLIRPRAVSPTSSVRPSTWIGVGVALLCIVAQTLEISPALGDTSAGVVRRIAAGDSEPVKIGFVTSLTGVAAEGGHEMVNAMQMYLEEANHHIAGRKLELIIEDDQSDPATAALRVRKLIEEDHCQILDGLCLSHLGYAAARIVDKLQVPMIFAVAGCNGVTQRQPHPWIIRTGFTSSQPYHPFGEWVFKTLGYKKVVCFALDYPYGWECVGGFQRTFEESGGKVVQKLWAPLGFHNFGHFISQIDKDADAVFIIAPHAPCDTLLKEIKESGLKMPILASAAGFDDDRLGKMGDAALGVMNVGSYGWTIPSQANRAFVNAYRKRFGKYPTLYAASSYVSGQCIGKALGELKGKTSDKRKLLEALKRVNLPQSPDGPLKLDDHANAIHSVYVFQVRKVNGRLQNVPVHTFENVGQFWHWQPDEYLALPVYSKEYPPCRFCLR
jgi:branched-chain amino acid transport system substrate-binding protein